MKLTPITRPEWELVPLMPGWTGTVHALLSDGRVTLRLKVTRGEGADFRPCNLRLELRPGHRWVHKIYPTAPINDDSGVFVYGTSGSGLIAMSTGTPLGVQFDGEFTYLI